MSELFEVNTFSLFYKLWVEDINLGFKKSKSISIPSVMNLRLGALIDMKGKAAYWLSGASQAIFHIKYPR